MSNHDFFAGKSSLLDYKSGILAKSMHNLKGTLNTARKIVWNIGELEGKKLHRSKVAWENLFFQFWCHYKINDFFFVCIYSHQWCGTAHRLEETPCQECICLCPHLFGKPHNQSVQEIQLCTLSRTAKMFKVSKLTVQVIFFWCRHSHQPPSLLTRMLSQMKNY